MEAYLRCPKGRFNICGHTIQIPRDTRYVCVDADGRVFAHFEKPFADAKAGRWMSKYTAPTLVACGAPGAGWQANITAI